MAIGMDPSAEPRTDKPPSSRCTIMHRSDTGRMAERILMIDDDRLAAMISDYLISIAAYQEFPRDLARRLQPI